LILGWGWQVEVPQAVPDLPQILKKPGAESLFRFCSLGQYFLILLNSLHHYLHVDLVRTPFSSSNGFSRLCLRCHFTFLLLYLCSFNSTSPISVPKNKVTKKLNSSGFGTWDYPRIGIQQLLKLGVASAQRTVHPHQELPPGRGNIAEELPLSLNKP
jgi:hypothetical protein